MKFAHLCRSLIVAVLCAWLLSGCSTNRVTLQRPWEKQAIASADTIFVLQRDRTVTEVHHPTLEGVPPDEHIRGFVDAPYGQELERTFPVGEVVAIEVGDSTYWDTAANALAIVTFVGGIVLIVLLF